MARHRSPGARWLASLSPQSRADQLRMRGRVLQLQVARPEREEKKGPQETRPLGTAYLYDNLEINLEHVLERKLNQARVDRRAVDHAEGRRGNIYRVWSVELGMVEGVEELGAKHQSRILA